MTRPIVSVLMTLGIAAASAMPTASAMAAAEREWQTGVWREAKIDRPRISFGVRSGDPNSTVPRTSTARETRTYIVETETLRFELRQDTTADAARLDVVVGEPVTFAVEKKIVYVKDKHGKEHRFVLRTQTRIER